MPARPLSALSLRAAFGWLTGGAQATALVPLVLLAVYVGFGETAMFVLAALVPAAIVIARVAGQHDCEARDGVTGLKGPEAALTWLERTILGRDSFNGTGVMCVTLDEMTMLEERVSMVMRDSILHDMAGRLGRLIRADDLLTRGETSDFLLCLNAIAPPETENLLQLAQRLQAMMDEPFLSGSVRVYCTVSIGIAQVRHVPAAKPPAVIRAAEAAVTRAQANGPGCIRLHQPTGSEPLASDGDLGRQISSALETGQIVAWYQPQVSTDTGEISGFEALARWEHPSRGLVSPVSFIDLSRRAGLAQRLSEVVLTHALSALRAWDKADLGIPSVSVNLGSDDLRNPRIFDYLRWELDRHDIAPRRLAIEVLEDVIAERHDDVVARNLRALADLGCRIELDDFGTGYTSILNIRRFSVSRIKIDRKLVARIDMDKDQRDLVAALLAMAERLKIDTLGEGVETAAEHAMLAQLGADHVQGFALARPMPLGDTFNWIRAHRATIASSTPATLPAAPDPKPG